MKNRADYLDSLVEEGLIEAAENFFGRRKNLEVEIEEFQALLGALANQASKVRYWRRILLLLLFDETSLLSELFQSLGVDSIAATEIFGDPTPDVTNLGLPYALTMGGRYRKMLVQIYLKAAEAVDEYYYGRHYADKTIKTKKVLSVHYHMVQDVCRDLNKKIQTLNTFSRPSDMLQFTKRINVESSDKERIVDAGVEYTLDDDMSFKPIHCDKLPLPMFVPLPFGQKDEEIVVQFAERLIKKRKGDVARVMKMFEK